MVRYIKIRYIKSFLFTLFVLFVIILFVASITYAGAIPSVMFWKYNAKCADNKAGDTIIAWDHPTISQPSPAQVILDIAEYDAYVSSGQQAEEEKTASFNKDITKAIGLTMKDFMNEIMAGRVTSITNSELRDKFKSYLP